MKLNHHQRHLARANVLHGARLMLAHRSLVHYSQRENRWQGMDRRLRVVRHQFPHYSDCSSAATWLLWNALTHALRDMTIPDVVNGTGWGGGFTGTMAAHGKYIPQLDLIGDCAFYGPPPHKHVVVYIGGGMVFSHGSEPGPFKLDPHYRGDLWTRRRYILA